MKKEHLKNATRLVLDYYEDRGDTDHARAIAALEDMEAGAHPSDFTLYLKAARSVENGCYACYYNDAEKDLQFIYGDDYNHDRYYTSNGDLRRRGHNGKSYTTLWMQYIDIMAQALMKIAKMVNWEER